MSRKVLGIGVLLAVVLAALYFLTRPAPPSPFDPDQLAPAEVYPSLSGVELVPEYHEQNLYLSVYNNTGGQLMSATTETARELEVQFENQWYQVPCEEAADTFAEFESAPALLIEGWNFTWIYPLSLYGTLPDGQYRIPYGYWDYESTYDQVTSGQPQYSTYAEFAVKNGRYIFPSDSGT